MFKENLYREALKRYLGPHVLAEIDSRRQDALIPFTDKRTLTVAFIDLAGFTTVRKHLSPEDLIALLNSYLGWATAHIEATGGATIDITGDSIIAAWGLDSQDHAQAACASMSTLLVELSTLRVAWQKKDLPMLDLQIGIATGQVMYGATGSERRLKFQLMGDRVNHASRLAAANHLYGTQVIAADETVSSLSGTGVLHRQLDTIRVKGIQEPQAIHQVF